MSEIPQSTIPRWRVLIFPGATEIALELRQALAWCKEVELFSAAAPVSNHAPFVFKEYTTLPFVTQDNWLADLQKLIQCKQITHILPAHDDVLLALAEHTSKLSAKVVTSPLDTCRITRSKSATYELLSGVVPTPAVYKNPDKIVEFPVFIKPDRGQGSQNAYLVSDLAQLDLLMKSHRSVIAIEYLPGREYTIDCFSDRDRGLLYVQGRERRRIKSGIAMDSIPVADPSFADYARRISGALKFHGAWFFQVKYDRAGVLKLLEIAPRIAGTSALSRARGVNLPLLSLYEVERAPVKIALQPIDLEIDRALVNRYRHNIEYDAVYVDLDDTLVVHDRVNPELMKLLYQAANRGVRLILLTRCAGDVEAILRRHRLTGLFDEIIHLCHGESKADSIHRARAIFIDDSFAERSEVHSRTGIPVFDPSAIEVLFDERV